MPSSHFDWLVGELEGWLHGNLNELGRHAVEAFLALPGLARWSPQDIQHRPFDLLMLLDYGLPFALLNGNDSANALRRKIGMEIVARGKPRQSDWSEVCAGALLQHIGAGVRFVPRSKFGKTPDIFCTLADNTIVEVEVTAAEQKSIHSDVQKALLSLAEVLSPGDQKWNLAVFCSDASDDAQIDSVLNAVVGLNAGMTAGVVNCWEVQSLENDQTPTPPSWWPQSETAEFNSRAVRLDLPSYWVAVNSLPPREQNLYMNPLRNKADFPQWSGDRAAVIALDVGELPNAFHWLPGDLETFFSSYPEVSAVLAFMYIPFCGFKRTWRTELYVNENAKFSVPFDTLRLALPYLEKRKCMEIDFQLSG